MKARKRCTEEPLRHMGEFVMVQPWKGCETTCQAGWGVQGEARARAGQVGSSRVVRIWGLTVF